MGLSTLPPIKAVKIPSILFQQQQQKRKYRTSRHHYLLRMKKEESLRMRRLGSGLLEQHTLDSTILTHLVSLLDSQRGSPFIVGGDLQEVDTRSHVSDHSSLFKPPSSLPAPLQGVKARRTSRGTWTTTSVEDGGGHREVQEEEGAVTNLCDMSTASSSLSSIPQLPPISKHPLSPIKDISREGSLLVPALPTLRKDGYDENGMPTVQVMPATPQHSTLTALPTFRSHGADTDRSVSEASGYNVSSDSSLADPSVVFGQRSSRKSKTRRTKGQYASRSRGADSTAEAPSLRGSMVLAPGGEIIHVGGAIPPAPPPQHDVGNLRDVTPRLRHYDGGILTDDSGLSDEEGGEWRVSGRRRKSRFTSSQKAGSPRKKGDGKSGGRNSVTEQDILDTLSDHAKQIADQLLAKDEAGRDLERDVRDAADLWMESHPARDASRSQSAQDALQSGALEDLMNAYRASSADPTAAEYRNLIRQSLTTAVAKAAGLSIEQIPEDLEISADLLEALANQKLSPDDLTIVSEEGTGRPLIRSRQELPVLLEDRSPGVSPSGQELRGVADGASAMDKVDYEVIHADMQGAAVDGASPATEYGLKSTEQAGLPPGLLTETNHSGRAEKTTTTSEQPLVTGVADHKAELSKLFGADAVAAGKSKKAKKDSKKRGKKGRKGRKDEDSTHDTEGEGTPPPSLKNKDGALLSSDEPQSPKSRSPSSSDRALQSSPDLGKSDDDAMVFSTIKKDVKPAQQSTQKSGDALPFPDDDDEDEDDEEDSEEKSQANREARAARRAAQAAKRKEEVDRRRKEREEQMKQNKEEMERQEQLKREMEMERLRREEEKRLRKLREEEDADREERELKEEERQRLLEEERERKAREEHQRKLDQMRREQMEEEARRRERLLAQEREEEERRAQEELMLSQMAEEERREYEERKRQEEEARKRKEEEERRKREEEAANAMAEAKRLAEEMARKQAALESRMRFNRSLRTEARNLGHSQEINRAFVFSYFQLMQWLGLDIPQFEMSKMGRY